MSQEWTAAVCPGWSSTASCSKGSAHAADREDGTRTRSRLISPCSTLTRLTLTVWQQIEHPGVLYVVSQYAVSKTAALVMLRTREDCGRLATPAHPLFLQSSVTCADGLVAGARIGLYSHRRTHLWSEIRPSSVHHQVCAKFYTGQLRFGSTRGKTLFLSKKKQHRQAYFFSHFCMYTCFFNDVLH